MVGNETTRYEMGADHQQEARAIMKEVLEALREKGYNPVNQLVGYFLSGDPTYITNHKSARAVIRRMERDELLEMIITDYINHL
ncbi:MAG: IreB family regulatory phosphoprotein [Clostridia bacterium]|nr:IreB family regulatory phosphoprotein [Clostridia bacterium]